MIQFPHNFLWGAATSAYQVEGNNINADWWEWEKRVGLQETSGLACRHYEFFECDFDLAKILNQNTHRLSIEWSRIEPEEGRFCEQEIAHYKDVIFSLKQRNLEPIVTLHHFTNPLWFAKIGGWQNNKACYYFLRYVERIVGALSDKVKYWVTINEPMVYVYHAYILGIWPPQQRSFLKARRAQGNLILSHIKSYRLIHKIYREQKLNSPLVSIAQNTQAFVPCILTLRNRVAAYLRDKYFNFEFIDRLIRAKTIDFIGINYYTRSLVETQGFGLKNLALDVCNKNHSSLNKNSLGWDIFPEGLYSLLLKLKKYNLPIFILENGVCIRDDKFRWDFIRQHLKNIHRAMEEGVELLGYIYWSLIDNYEWDKGFGPRFGLIEVDYSTYKRIIRESARNYAHVCKTGELD